jgi:hypothetical protein
MIGLARNISLYRYWARCAFGRAKAQQKFWIAGKAREVGEKIIGIS